MKNWKRT